MATNKKIFNSYDDLVEYQDLLIEAYEIHEQDQNERYKQLSLLGGTIIQIELEVVSYKLKNPNNGKIKASEDRLNILKSVFDCFSRSSGKLDRMKLLMAANNARVNFLEEENKKIKQELYAAQRAFEEL